jgi:phosphoribosylformylglycinamidine synthase I
MNTRVLVLRSPGTNCDEETAHAFELAGARAERLHVGALLRRERRLEEFHILALPGGFSFGDDLGAGTVLANRLRTYLEEDLAEFVDSGRLVIGICNGFQVLVRLGLLPGWKGEKAVSLVENASGKFEDRWVRLRVDSEVCPFLLRRHGVPERGGKGFTFRIPVAHREGRFLVRDPEVLARLVAGRQVALTYVEGEGATGPAEAYPQNPNGSVEGIAGITNPAGNVLGLMPHPERHVRLFQDPLWTRRASREDLPPDEERAGAGFFFFENAVKHAAALDV